MTQNQLAKKYGISQGHLANVLRGNRRFGIETAERIAEEIGLGADQALVLIKAPPEKLCELLGYERR